MAIVAVTTAHEPEPESPIENVADEVTGQRAVDEPRRVQGFAAAVHRDNLGDRLQLRIRRELPVGRNRATCRMMGHGQAGFPRNASHS